MKVTIDPDAGFCFGVEKAIHRAEKELSENRELLCLGELVHNPSEMNRLKKLGLKTANLQDALPGKNRKVLFRAHGEPPESYQAAIKLNMEVVDATCPIVLKLQKDIHLACQEMNKRNGQVVLFGREGHPEVKGLIGHAGGEVILVSSLKDMKRIDFSRPVSLFSQTTADPMVYEGIAVSVGKKMSVSQSDDNLPLSIHHSICKRVSKRVPALKKFAKNHDVIIFAGSQTSSNSQLLFDVCSRNNPQSYFVETAEELRAEWFNDAASAGISGATSTPDWLLNQIKQTVYALAPD
jgi:4-hydroxy-3-methylbut-2-en-1-yl diphosphate reductase